METHSLDLEFSDDQKSDLPHSPIAGIYVKTFSRRIADGLLLITPDCVTIREFEYQVDQLKAELDTILKKARAKFAADDRRQTARAARG
jgi:hypothetical protein